jgi:hypothetical protein
LDEVSNYRAAYVREDSDSVTNYGQRAYKIVNSRWISAENQTAAVLMAARVGRRFSESPRMLNLSMDAKDADVWAGDSVKLETDLIEQTGGGFPQLNYQVISASEKMNFEYSMLEHTYGPALPQDQDIEDPDTRLVYISGEQDQLKDDAGNPRTLREYYEAINTEPLEAQFDVRFIFESNAVAGSSDNTQHAIKTGAWPELTTPPLIVNSGLILGKGGRGASIATVGFSDGGPAILLENDIRLNNLNTIAGGGGGGNKVIVGRASAAGGGGAGFYNGIAGGGTGYNPANDEQQNIPAENGTHKLGGSGAFVSGTTGGEFESATGGDGGDLGQAGGAGGGAAGKAIDLNGFTVTYINTGTIAGAVS